VWFTEIIGQDSYKEQNKGVMNNPTHGHANITLLSNPVILVWPPIAGFFIFSVCAKNILHNPGQAMFSFRGSAEYKCKNRP
jgi:hypothetical protein